MMPLFLPNNRLQNLKKDSGASFSPEKKKKKSPEPREKGSNKYKHLTSQVSTKYFIMNNVLLCLLITNESANK